VDHHAVADHAALSRIEDPRGDQVELPLLLAAHDRVAGVVASLEAHDRVAVFGEQIGDLALPLIAPLGADYHYSRHGECSLGRVAAMLGRGDPPPLSRRAGLGGRAWFPACGTRAACPRRTAAAGRRGSRPAA